MKNLKLTQQIIFLIILILLVCCCLFTTLIIFQGGKFAEAEMYSRLEVILSIDNEEEEMELPKAGMRLVWVEGNLNVGQYKINESYEEVITSAEREEIIKNLSLEYSKMGHSLMITEKAKFDGVKDNIYYIYNLENSGHFKVILTDSTFIKSIMNKLTAQMFLIFFVVMLAAIVVITTWSQGVVRRIKKIQNHINNMPKEGYAAAYNDSGDDEIADLSYCVEDMRIQIKESEYTKKEMLQNISHDLKTPIAVIKSYAESILDGVSDVCDSTIIIQQADTLKNKVNKLLQYNRLEYLTKETSFEEVAMKEVIEEVVLSYKYQTAVNFELDLDDVYFKGYRENFYTVIDNIVDNAKRYAQTKIKIILREKEIVIYNDGKHIDEQFINAAFKPYEKGSEGQFGLGMSIVKKTLDFFDMKLEVRNENIGVSFIIKK